MSEITHDFLGMVSLYHLSKWSCFWEWFIVVLPTLCVNPRSNGKRASSGGKTTLGTMDADLALALASCRSNSTCLAAQSCTWRFLNLVLSSILIVENEADIYKHPFTLHVLRLTKSSTIITGVIFTGLTKIVWPKSSGLSMFIVIKSVCHPQTGGVWKANIMIRSYSNKTTWWKIHDAKNHDVYHGNSGFPEYFLTKNHRMLPKILPLFTDMFLSIYWLSWMDLLLKTSLPHLQATAPVSRRPKLVWS